MISDWYQDFEMQPAELLGTQSLSKNSFQNFFKKKKIISKSCLVTASRGNTEKLQWVWGRCALPSDLICTDLWYLGSSTPCTLTIKEKNKSRHAYFSEISCMLQTLTTTNLSQHLYDSSQLSQHPQPGTELLEGVRSALWTPHFLQLMK